MTGTNVTSQDDRKSMSLGVSTDYGKQFKYVLSQVSMIKLDNKSEGGGVKDRISCVPPRACGSALPLNVFFSRWATITLLELRLLFKRVSVSLELELQEACHLMWIPANKI